MSLYFKFCLFILTVFVVDSFDVKDLRQLSKIEILNSSQSQLAKYTWFKIKKSVCNDEYDEWMCCDFYYSKNEKIQVVYSDSKGLYPNYMETNLNLFQKNMHLKVHQLLKDVFLDGKYAKLITNDDGLAEIQEFDQVNKNKYLHAYSLSCSEGLSVAIEDKLKSKNNRVLPKKLQQCKIISCRIFKNFDDNNKLFQKP